MSVRFVIGRAGAGKTDWCFNQIVAELRASPMGSPIYWLLPRQATFQAERDLVCRGGLDGFFRVRVLSLDEMAREILSADAGSIVPRITDKGRRLIFAHLLRVHRGRLRYFQGVAQYPGMAGQLDAVLSELHRQGADVGEAASNLNSPTEPAPPGLAAKFHDIALLHEEYLRFTGDQRLDPERRMAQAVSAVAGSAIVRDAIVYIDAFDDFTFFERRFVTAIAQAARDTSITFLLDTASPLVTNPHHVPDQAGIFHRTETAYRSLWFSLHQAKVAIDEPILLARPRRFVRPDLDRLEQSFHAELKPAAPLAPDSLFTQAPAVEFYEADDRRAEIDLAARKIRDLVLSGLRYRDIALLVRDLATCADLIHSALAEHAIPCFIDQRRSAGHHPLPRLIRATLAIAKNNWPHAAVMSALKSGLLDIDPRHADELENHVLAHAIVGTQWIDDDVWTDATPEVQAARKRLADILSLFVSAVSGSSPRPVKTFADALIEFLNRAGARTRLAEWIESAHAKGIHEQAEEHRQTWAECANLLQELVDLMPDVSMPFDEFAAVMETSLDELDLGLAPQTVDQVLVGSIDRTHTPAIAVAIVMGLSEGIFPRPATAPRMLSDLERRSLAVRGIHVDPDSRQMALEEKFLGYQAFTRASRRLILTRPRTSDGGRLLKPSSLWLHAQQTLGQNVDAASDRADQADAIATPRQLIATLARWARDDAAVATPDDPRPALYQWLANRQPAGGDDPIDTVRRIAWKSLGYENVAILAGPVARELVISPRESGRSQIRVTPRDIDSFRNCRFQHFCRSSLRLSDRQNPGLNPRRLAMIYSKVLDESLHDLLRAQKDLTALDDKQLDASVDRALDRVAGRMFSQRVRKTPALRYRIDRIRSTLRSLIRSQKEFALAGRFRPSQVPVAFGDDAALPPLQWEITREIELHISGRIDRIDIGRPNASGVQPVAAVLYRLGASGLDMAMILNGRDAELLLYLWALAQADTLLGGQPVLPVAALIAPTGRDINYVSDPDEAPSADDPAFRLTPKPRGIINERFANQFDKSTAQGYSPVIAMRIRKDGAMSKRNSDLVDPPELDLLLKHVKECAVGAAGLMLCGEIAIKPYMHGKKTPCPHCDYRDVCRIERGDTVYDHIAPIDRAGVLEQLVILYP